MVDVPNTADYDWLNEIGLGISAGGALAGLAGTYYSLKAKQSEFRAEAQNAEFAANQANMQSRANEREAEVIIRAGQQEAGYRGALAALDVASSRAGAAASGVEVGSGSAGETERAIRLAAEVDKRTIRTNAERRAAATREAAANARGNSLIGRASAANLRASAGTVNPALGTVGAGMSSGGSLIGQYLAYNRGG